MKHIVPTFVSAPGSGGDGESSASADNETLKAMLENLWKC
jgi:hypothetical protein